MKLKELTSRLSPRFWIVLHDRGEDVGTVFMGELVQMRTFWDDREVAWIRPGPYKGLIVELESAKNK